MKKNELNDDVLDELQDNYECYNDELEKRLYYSIGHIERDDKTIKFNVTTNNGCSFECDNETDANLLSLLVQINERLKRVELKLKEGETLPTLFEM